MGIDRKHFIVTIGGLLAAFGAAMVLRYTSLAAAIAGSLTVYVNSFLLQCSIATLSSSSSGKKSFWKSLPFRLAIMIVLFYFFLVFMRLPLLSFLAGMIVMFIGYSIWLVRLYRQEVKK